MLAALPHIVAAFGLVLSVRTIWQGALVFLSIEWSNEP